MVFEVRGKERPATGWPEGAFGVQGTIQPIEAGYYRPILRRAGGAWKIATLCIVHTLPMAFPGQQGAIREVNYLSAEGRTRDPGIGEVGDEHCRRPPISSACIEQNVFTRSIIY